MVFICGFLFPDFFLSLNQIRIQLTTNANYKEIEGEPKMYLLTSTLLTLNYVKIIPEMPSGPDPFFCFEILGNLIRRPIIIKMFTYLVPMGFIVLGSINLFKTIFSLFTWKKGPRLFILWGPTFSGTRAIQVSVVQILSGILFYNLLSMF